MVDTSKSVEDLSTPLTEALRKAAESAGWPSMIVQELSVVSTGRGISVEYPDSMSSEVEDLEYGTLGKPPVPVLRTFLDKNQVAVQNRISEWTVERLFDSGVLP